MKKELIERIKAHKGEIVLTPENDNKVVVEFVPKKDTVVKCTNNEQYDFIGKKLWGERGSGHEYGSKDFDGDTFNAVNVDDSGVQDVKYYAKGLYNIIPFSQYISDNDLKDEWEKYIRNEIEKRYPIGSTVKCLSDGRSFIITGYTHHMYEWIIGIKDVNGSIDMGARCYNDGKWATIIEPKLELVKGEVYFDQDGDNSNIFRFNEKGNLSFSRWFINQKYLSTDCYCIFRELKPATNKQKAKLIKAEIKNGWLWDGKELIKL